ncbi:MAG: amidohydrolase [Bacteroidota bacterium]|nr:amidohydrolase [Bacteroidota bacterium]
MSKLYLTLIQYDIVWENKQQNFEKLNQIIYNITEQTDLILLPEMFQTGFSMNSPALAESMDDKTIKWMHEKAKEKDCYIAGSFICSDEGNYYNRFIVISPQGDSKYYNKRHSFGLGKENENYTAGSERITFQIKGFKICPMVCYDLRFPVWSRNNVGYDILLYVANWPTRRSFAWKQLLIGRAIENQCFVAAVNRIGVDGNNIDHSGDSAVLNPDGSYIWQAKTNTQQVKKVELNLDYLAQFRNDFPFLKDADKFDMKF